MPRYRVTLRRTITEIVEAVNPYEAAIRAHDRYGEGAEVVNVGSAVGRPAATASGRKASKPTRKVAKKRRPLSPEARAKLAQNLVKARAARAAKRKAAGKKATRKKSTRKTTRR